MTYFRYQRTVSWFTTGAAGAVQPGGATPPRTHKMLERRFMDPIIWIAAAALLILFVLRFVFRLTGLIIRLVLLAAVGLAIWWLFSGM